MNDILNDTAKFYWLQTDPIETAIRQENRRKNYLQELKNEDIISQQLYHELSPISCRPGILYSLPKVHKNNAPL